jgi:transcriptional regulator with XRE-family HTH domain
VAGVRFQQRVAALLVERGVTIESFARLLGLTPTTSRRLLAGSLPPTRTQAARVAAYLGEDEETLFYPPRRDTRFRPKACRACGAQFEPNNPNGRYCPECRARRAA